MTKLFFINYAFVIIFSFNLFVKCGDDISNTFFKFEFCEATSTFSSIGENGLPQYAAENALTRGSGYWCSEGKHNVNDVVSWIGHLKNVRSLNGIIIHWAYTPGEVSILASYDGNEPYEEVVPYQVLESRVGNVVQNIIFNHVIRAKSIKVNMRHAIHDYFGINFTNVLGSRDPTLRIQSGMSSLTQDLCLQIDEKNEVVLDGCITAISYLDGRDLWKLNSKNQIYNPINNLCITLKDNLIANGGRLILEDCNASLEHNDGRSSWQLLPNNQLKILRNGNFCLSQDGHKSGSIDVALHKECMSTLSSDNKNHSPDKVVDGLLDTFWVSQEFNLDTAPDSVHFDVNLGSIYKLQKAIIDWKYPATKYSISLSNDGENFKEVSSNLANFLRSTINNLHNTEAQYIRLTLRAPNPEFSEENKLFYGIKKFSVYSNRIKSIVDDCDKIKDTDDARDKYFFEFVSEVNLQEGKELKRLDNELQLYAEKIQNEALKIQSLNPKLKKCKLEKEKRHKDISNIKNVILKNIYEVIKQTENIIKMNPLSSYYSTSTKELGQTSDNPADNCFHLKNALPSSPSGFYYVLTTCSQNVLRVFCDMKIGATYYIPFVDNKIINKLKDVENVCATYGLNPIHLYHESQIYTLRKVFDTMDINITNPVPLAIRKEDSEFYYSLDFQTNVHDIIAKFGTPVGNTFGINNIGVTFFDSSSSEMSAFVCSDNINSINLPEPFVNLDCQSSLKETSEIEKMIGNEYLIKCPHDCLERDIEESVIGGEGNIYSEDSSICLSAIHAGIYDKHYLIHLRVINALNEYGGFFQNGIISESFLNNTQEVGFKLFHVPPKCPKDDITSNNYNNNNYYYYYDNSSAMFSFLELDNKMNNVNDKFDNDDYTYVDSSTADAINDLITIVNKQVGSTDPTFLALINKQSIKIISNARRYLKPTEIFEKNIELLSNETLKDVEKVFNLIKVLSSKINSELEKRKYKLEILVDERLRQKEFESWKLDNIDNIYDTFEIINSVQLQQVGKWNILDNPLYEGINGITLVQNVRVYNSPENSVINSFNGSYAFLRYKSFYDFVFSTYVNIKGVGSVGLIFRSYDKYNFYMLELNNDRQKNEFNKRLLKFENNIVTELAIVNGNDLQEGDWFVVRIECIGSKIMITVLKTNKPIYELPKPDIIINDDFTSSGTIGFYTYGIDNVQFTNITVESVECSTKEILSYNISPISCNIYEEYYVGKFNKSYIAFDSENSNGGTSNWKFAKNVGNEKHVILQNSNKKEVENEEQIPSFIILQNKSCQTGVLNFSVYPECSNGIVGTMFKFLDSKNYTILEIGSGFTRLRQNVNGKFQLLSKSIISGYKEHIWNRVTISFSSNNINVNLGTGFMTYPIFSLIGLHLSDGESVGFTSYNCSNVSFSNIYMHPFDFKPYTPTPTLDTESFLPPIFSKFNQVTIKEEDQLQDMGYKQIGDNKNSDISKESAIDKHSFEDSTRQMKKDAYYCATHKNIVDIINYCNQYDKENDNCTNEFCTICCNNIDTKEEEDIRTCEILCQKLDDKILQTSEVLNYLKKSCIESPNEELKKSCEDDNDKEECLIEMCEMCCQSVTIPDDLLTSHMDIDSLTNHCISLCDKP
ncbi:LCCL domain-containing protein [Plasmodium reichenowi]|uniref:LCCL domain-containing protein n=1 Tax=Plasmodium reichenowi TaxID=5854 RepID=A0A2P9DQC0_PLARE|nr:LCCL domain-containing protein [Plasmodium reichenowi]